MKKIHLVVALMPVIWLSCKSPGDSKKVPAVTIENPVKESELTTVRLTEKSAERLGIRTAPMESSSVISARVYSGEIMAIPGRSMTLNAPVSGTVLGIKGGVLPLAGTAIRKGQVLYRLLILPSEKDLISAQEDVKLRRVQYDVAVEKLKRAEQLLLDKAGSVRARQDAESELANVTAGLRVAEARVELMKGNSSEAVTDKLSTLNIESSVDGFIQRVYASPSQVVSANAPIMDVAAISPLWVRVPVYAGDLGLVNGKIPARVRPLSSYSGAENEIIAQPVQGPQTADPLNTSADFFYEISNADMKFRPGERVSVTVSLKQEQTSLVIPFSAIVYDIQGGTWVYENPTPLIFIRRRVEVARVDKGIAILRRGPAAGTSIVVEGVAELFGTEFGTSK
jgi:RND family efflux transporter MFP subunit